MIDSPTFSSVAAYRAGRTDLPLWRPYLEAVLERHDLWAPNASLVAGHNPTHPTFVCGDVVVKLFGGIPEWRRSHEAERSIHDFLDPHQEIRAPRVLAEDCLQEGGAAPWPYLITTRMPGTALQDAAPSVVEAGGVARALGEQVRLLHALEPSAHLCHLDWPSLDVESAAAESSLPSHLVRQAADYVAGIETNDHVFVHADLTRSHVFVENGGLAGIIDWGDAVVADRHLEIIQIYRDVFDCDKALLRTFLKASAWPMRDDFPRRAMAQALHRQALGLVQHLGMDVFEPIAAAFPLDDIATLDELALALFDE